MLGGLVLGLFGPLALAGTHPALLFSTITVAKDGRATARDTSGRTRTLGIDPELQAGLEEILARARPLAGAAVITDVASGQVLAAAEIGTKVAGELLLEPGAPAASLFKLVTTAALYERGGVKPSDRICTKGGLRDIGEEHLTPAAGPGTVCAPFSHALAVSRNAAYAQLSTEKLMREDLLAVAEGLGFNQALPLDVAGHVGSLSVPFNDLEFARTAAGFENSRLSVFGAARLALTIASLGAPPAMHFAELEPGGERARLLSTVTARRLRRSMEITVQSGTARDAFLDESGRNYLGYLQVAGKTGTLKPHRGGPTSSWFVGFAPSEKPAIAISVLHQISDHWHQKAPTTARDLFRLYFSRHGARNVTSPLRPKGLTPTTSQPSPTEQRQR